MKWLALGLGALLLLLQYRLWFAEGGLSERWRLEAKVAAQQDVNAALRERNRQLEQQVLDLRGGLGAVEELARENLGMVREGETYYQLVDGEVDDAPSPPQPKPRAEIEAESPQ